jgi:hypothetical protein
MSLLTVARALILLSIECDTALFSAYIMRLYFAVRLYSCSRLSMRTPQILWRN